MSLIPESYGTIYPTVITSGPAPAINEPAVATAGLLNTLQDYRNPTTAWWELSDGNSSTITTNVLIGGADGGEKQGTFIPYGLLLENSTGISFFNGAGTPSSIDTRVQVLGSVGSISTIAAPGQSYSENVVALNCYNSGDGLAYGSLAVKELIIADGQPITSPGPFPNIISDAGGTILNLNGGGVAVNASTITMSTIVNYTVPGSQTGQRGTQTTRPLMVDINGNVIKKPSQPMIRFFSVQTPSATGSPTLIQDASGNTYNANNWTCCVVGFNNVGGDRTYNCYCYFDVNRNWYVQYDQAGGNGVVNIMAVHNSLYVDGSN